MKSNYFQKCAKAVRYMRREDLVNQIKSRIASLKENPENPSKRLDEIDAAYSEMKYRLPSFRMPAYYKKHFGLRFDIQGDRVFF
jgi:hypothetical protein